MLKINLRVLGLSRVVDHFTGMKGRLTQELGKGMQEAAFLVEGAAKRQLTSGPNRAIRTGYLRSSIGVTSLTPFQARVQAQANYGRYVHQGTRYMKARPFMAAGMRDALPEMEKIFGRRLKTLIETV